MANDRDHCEQFGGKCDQLAKTRAQLSQTIDQWALESIKLERVKTLVKAWRDGEPEGRRSASSVLRAILDLTEVP